MKKIEITHNKSVLGVFERLLKKKIILGFTSVQVEKSFGSLNGDFSYDQLSEEKYHTFIYEEDNRFDETLKKIKEESEDLNIKIFYSKINKAF